MQPTPVRLVLQRQDLLRDVMERRAAQLEGLYPQFKEQFQQLERKLKEHAGLLKGRQDAGGEQLMRNVLEELELKEYNFHKENHKSTQRTGRTSPRKQVSHAEQTQSNRPHESQRSSETSDLGFRPYHISNFKRSLQSLRMNVGEDSNRGGRAV